MASGLKQPQKPASSAGAKKKDLRILGFVNTPVESKVPTKKVNYTLVVDFEMPVKPETTIREIKDFTLERLPTLRYYQMEFEYWNKILKDAITVKQLREEHQFFPMVNCLHLHIIIPDEMFKMMYKTFSDMGMNEEKALEATKSFMDTVQNKDIDYEYDIAMRFEAHRLKLAERGIIITNPYQVPTVCE